MQQVMSPYAPSAIGPYSQAIKTGDYVYASGQIPLNKQTGEIPEGIEAQANQVFKNLRFVLEAGGSSLTKVVKTTIFLKNIDDFDAVNTVYKKYFVPPFPARSCIEVSRLPKDVLIECEAIGELVEDFI